MPINSYVVIPISGGKSELESFLGSLPAIEVVPAEKKEVVVIVTDTTSDQKETELLDKIKASPYLEHITMVFGSDPDQFNLPLS